MRGSGITGERDRITVWSGRGWIMEPGQYLDGKTDRWEGSCYRRGVLESWKAEGLGDGFGRELDA